MQIVGITRHNKKLYLVKQRSNISEFWHIRCKLNALMTKGEIVFYKSIHTLKANFVEVDVT